MVPARCVAVDKDYVAATGVVRALKGVDAEFEAGQVIVISGPSGSGKSSLLRILACVDRPTRGTVEIGGVEVAKLSARKRRRLRRQQIGYVFQNPADNLLPYLDAEGHLELSARLRGSERPGERRRLLEALGLEHRREALPGTLSGGEQQRLAFASAVIGGPALVVADEPTAELDHESGELVLAAIRRLREEGASFVMSSHDPVVAGAADKVIEIHDGEVVTPRGWS